MLYSTRAIALPTEHCGRALPVLYFRARVDSNFARVKTICSYHSRYAAERKQMCRGAHTRTLGQHASLNRGASAREFHGPSSIRVRPRTERCSAGAARAARASEGRARAGGASAAPHRAAAARTPLRRASRHTSAAPQSGAHRRSRRGRRRRRRRPPRPAARRRVVRRPCRSGSAPATREWRSGGRQTTLPRQPTRSVGRRGRASTRPRSSRPARCHRRQRTRAAGGRQGRCWRARPPRAGCSGGASGAAGSRRRPSEGSQTDRGGEASTLVA